MLCDKIGHIGHVVLLKVYPMDIYYISIISHLKGGPFPLNKLEFPFNKGCFVPRFVETCPVVLEKKIILRNVCENNYK